MPTPIFLRVGTESHIDLSMFVDSVRDFLRILKDVDATVSEDKLGSVRWRVEALEKRDAAIIGVIPVPRKSLIEDQSSKVEAQVIENTTLLSTKGERTEFLPDRALDYIGKMAARTPRIGPMAIWTPQNGRPRQETAITRATLRNVQELTSEKFKGFGSITGKLESISVHKDAEFRIWDDDTGKPVRCFYKPNMEEQVKDALRKTVTVVGEMSLNKSGLPVSIVVDSVSEIARRSELAPVSQLSGIIKDFTGGVSLKEYLEEIADE